MIPPFTTIHLDITLGDLYCREGLNNLIYLPHYPSSYIDLGPNLPRNQKFHIDDVLQNMPTDWAESQRQAYAMQVLGSFMMRFKFFLGNIDVLMICSKDSPPQLVQGKSGLGLVIPSRVDPLQMSKNIIQVRIDDPDSDIINIIAGLGKTLIVSFPHDWCLSLPHAVNPEKHYLFHSKAYLTRLPLNVPHQEIFNLDANLIHTIRGRPLPFVVKKTHGMWHNGTWIVKDERGRATVIEALEELLELSNDISTRGRRKILVTEYISAVRNYCTHFFVGRKGISAFLGVTEQLLDRSSHWQGIINFEKQPVLKLMFDNASTTLARALADDGYIGPAGADILVDSAGKQWLIDLNPRINGGTTLCLLQQHLSVQRQLHHATTILGVQFGGSPVAFTAAFQNELDRGKLIVLTLNRWDNVNGGKERYSCGLVCAGETVDELNSIVDMIYDYGDMTLAT